LTIPTSLTSSCIGLVFSFPFSTSAIRVFIEVVCCLHDKEP
jgi:hypothetical protein